MLETGKGVLNLTDPNRGPLLKGVGSLNPA